MRRNKVDYVVIGIALILLFIIGIIAFLSLTTPVRPPDEPTLPTIAPTHSPTPAAIAPPAIIDYDLEAEERLIDSIKNRKTLSKNDIKAKDTLLNTKLKGYNSGVAYESANVRIEYMKSLDLFLANIKTANIAAAKAEAHIWLRSQGFSQKGICQLPVMFTLDFLVAQQLQKQNILFSPLPNGC